MAGSTKRLTVTDWGLIGYKEALCRQIQLVDERLGELSEDSLILVEHYPVVTIGRSGGHDDLIVPEDVLRHNGIELYQADRGGKATFHEPGQLVVYSITKLENNDVRLYIRTLLEAAAAVLRAYGLNPEFKDGRPGLWVQSQKIVCVGVSVKKGVTYHGIAINVNNDLKGYKWIVPCGHSGEVFTSIMKECGGFVAMSEVKRAVIKEFKRCFHYGDSSWGLIRIRYQEE